MCGREVLHHAKSSFLYVQMTFTLNISKPLHYVTCTRTMCCVGKFSRVCLSVQLILNTSATELSHLHVKKLIHFRFIHVNVIIYCKLFLCMGMSYSHAGWLMSWPCVSHSCQTQEEEHSGNLYFIPSYH